MPAIDVGQKAPPFTLPKGGGGDVSLDDVLKEKSAVLAFYVLDFTGT